MTSKTRKLKVPKKSRVSGLFERFWKASKKRPRKATRKNCVSSPFRSLR